MKTPRVTIVAPPRSAMTTGIHIFTINSDHLAAAIGKHFDKRLKSPAKVIRQT
jgi:hypothetical protein